jgi:ssDNA-binding Zn-finger/Zn-ribbon topoisomerase 1
MTEIYTAANNAHFWLLKSYLESNGIECEVTNDILQIISGDVPTDQCWPKLNIVDDKQIDLAQSTIREFQEKTKDDDLPSFCPECDSENIELATQKKGIFRSKYRCMKCGYQWQKAN